MASHKLNLSKEFPLLPFIEKFGDLFNAGYIYFFPKRVTCRTRADDVQSIQLQALRSFHRTGIHNENSAKTTEISQKKLKRIT